MSGGRGHARDQGPLECKVYVGNLGSQANRYELEDAFKVYGPLRNVWVARNPPGFAFIQYEDKYDAEDAVKYLNNKMVCGRRVQVDLSSGESRRGGFRGGPGGGGGSRGRRDISDERCYECGKRGHFARDCFGRRDGYSSRRRSRSRSRSKSRSRSPRRSRSRSRSPKARSPKARSPKARSPSKSRSRSGSRSQD